MNTELKPCPFCGGEVQLQVCDDEGNFHDDEYEFNAWSGLGFLITHDVERNQKCPIAEYEGEYLGTYIYDSREEAAEAWNRRADNVQSI